MPDLISRDTSSTARWILYHSQSTNIQSFSQLMGTSSTRSHYTPDSDAARAILHEIGQLRGVCLMYTAFRPSQVSTRKGRYARAARLVRGWLKDDSGHDETIWPVLESELRADRLQFGK